MPHIHIEATLEVAKLLEFKTLLQSIHTGIDALGYARLEDFKSRVYVPEVSLAGDDPRGQFVVARLTMTNPRPAEMRRAMAQLIHNTLSAAIDAHNPDFQWQCCVFEEAVNPSSYLKTISPPSIPGGTRIR
jgi:5-carboxymethyl-2-hydroxymuconate isomerase